MLWRNFFEKLIAIMLATTFMLGNQLLSAKSMPDNQNNIPLLVFDEDDNLKIPKRFRTCQYLFKENTYPTPTRLGLDTLQMAGSGQFSKATLSEAIKELKGPVWIIDLRQESHGFLNDLPISWYSQGNASNLDESSDNVQREEEMLFNDIKNQGVILISKILEKQSGNIIKTKQVSVKIQSAHTESALLNNMNLGYLRLGVLDHHRPSDATVDDFLDFVKDLPQEAWLYFHCRGGVGRTTTFMVMYDILKNSHQVSLNDIVQRQALLGGSNLFEISDSKEDAWKKQAAVDRKHFIEKFYQYSKDHKGYPHQTWTQWSSHH